MRLREIYKRCNERYEKVVNNIINLKSIYEGFQKKQLKDINMFELQRTIDQIVLSCKDLREISGFKNVFEDIDDIMMYGQVDEKIEILDKLQFSLGCVLNLLDSIGVSENKLGLDIKMPLTDNITDFRKYVDDLEFIFTKCPFFYNEKESLKLKSVDIGSIWLVIGVAGVTIASGSILLNNIAAFIDKCYIIKSHKLTCEQQKIEIKKSQEDQKVKEEMVKVVEKVCEVSVNNAIKELEEVTKIEIKDNDERDRVSQSFERLDKLLDKGLQIYTAIDSPKEIKAVFAPIEMHYLQKNDNIPQIEEKSDEQ